MKQQRLETPQRTMYGVHRPARFVTRDPHSHVPFVDPAQHMQPWEFVAWSMIVGVVLGFIVFGGYFGYPW